MTQDMETRFKSTYMNFHFQNGGLSPSGILLLHKSNKYTDKSHFLKVNFFFSWNEGWGVKGVFKKRKKIILNKLHQIKCHEVWWILSPAFRQHKLVLPYCFKKSSVCYRKKFLNLNIPTYFYSNYFNNYLIFFSE